MTSIQLLVQRIFRPKYYADFLAMLVAAERLGLRREDILNASSFLQNHEYGLCLDVIASQIYEYNILIDRQFFDLIVSLCEQLEIDPDEYCYLQEMIR